MDTVDKLEELNTPLFSIMDQPHVFLGVSVFGERNADLWFYYRKEKVEDSVFIWVFGPNISDSLVLPIIICFVNRFFVMQSVKHAFRCLIKSNLLTDQELAIIFKKLF